MGLKPMASINIEPIGIIESDVSLGVDEHWGNVISRIKLKEEFKQGINGLADFSHCIVIFYLHKSNYVKDKHLQRRPQGRADFPYIGIFSQRAKHRPNPIGITSAEILEVNEEEGVIIVKGLDAINETPVIDIKPYFPQFDRREAKVPNWVNELMKNYFF
jgi:tRNA-Thr(GGU) m(6)t(6)A37 methyltransferase TsaA